jgi:MarR family transcriptional regulator, lower aerobic nicotinate degradation pathway regulator
MMRVMAAAPSSSKTEETAEAQEAFEGHAPAPTTPEAWALDAPANGGDTPADDLIEDIPRPMTGLLFRIARLYRDAMGERLKSEKWLVQVGFRPPCIGALMSISAHQPLSQRDLSDHLGVDPSDLVKVIDILERAGFVHRQRDPRDRRRYLLTLSPQGWSATRRLGAMLAELDDEVLEALTAAQRHMLRRLLEGVVAHHL